jgi:hypothetical protein
MPVAGPEISLGASRAFTHRRHSELHLLLGDDIAARTGQVDAHSTELAFHGVPGKSREIGMISQPLNMRGGVRVRGETNQASDGLVVAAHEDESLHQRVDRIIKPDRAREFRDLGMATPEHPLCLLPDEGGTVRTSILKAIAIPHRESADSGQEFSPQDAEAIPNVGGGLDQPEGPHVGPGPACGGNSPLCQHLHGKCEEEIRD